jgi:hypothetical protein
MTQRSTTVLGVVELLIDGDPTGRAVRLANLKVLQHRDERLAAARNVSQRRAGRTLQRAEGDPQHRLVRLGTDHRLARHGDGRDSGIRDDQPRVHRRILSAIGRGSHWARNPMM